MKGFKGNIIGFKNFIGKDRKAIRTGYYVLIEDELRFVPATESYINKKTRQLVEAIRN